MADLSTGVSGERSCTVSESNTALALGSGSVEVFATPAMIALMEAAAVAAIEPSLAAGDSSVGVAIDVKHLAATPVGQKVYAKAEVVAVDGRRVTFRVQAWDESALIGDGSHTRVVITVARFEAGLRSKRREE